MQLNLIQYNGSLEVLIYGPVRPVRGGIAKHTENLALALSQKYPCTVFYDSQPFPRRLYPGESQFSNELSIIDESRIRVKRNRYFSLIRDLLSQLAISRLSLTIVVWWTPALALKLFFVLLMHRISKRQFVIFCHNVLPHESGSISKVVTKIVLGMSNNFLVQSESEAQLLNSMFSKKRNVTVVPHPIFSEDQSAFDAQKNTDVCEILFIGFIRKYKGLDLLFQAIKQLEPPGTLRLVVAGECWDPKLRKMMELTSQSTSVSVELDLKFQGEADLEKRIRSCDFIVLPYHKVTGSGVLALAKSFRKPVIVSELPLFRQEVREGVDGFFFETGNVESLGTLLADLSLGSRHLPSAWSDQADDNGWTKIAEKAVAFWKQQEARQ